MTTIRIPGAPVPQGSMRTFPSGGMAHSNEQRLMGFRADVTVEWGSRPPIKGPVVLICMFTFARPAAHYYPANRRRLAPVRRPDSPWQHTQKPDVDKLLRAVMDALTGRAYADDEQVVSATGHKQWGTEGSTVIEVGPMEGDW